MKITGTLTDAALLLEVGKRLRRARIQRSLTQADLATNTGISRLTVLSLEAGRGSDLVSLIRVLRGLELLSVLEALLPGAEPGPVENRDTAGRGRQRVRKAKPVVAGSWKWGDER